MMRFLPSYLKSAVTMRAWAVLGVTGALASCGSPKEEATPPEEPAIAAAPAPKVSMAEWSLLEMSFDEAKALSPQHAEVGQYRVAGDSVEVLKKDDEGKALKVKAKGHVFIEINLPDRATALCDEATISVDEAMLYGGPIMMQSSRVAKSSSESTAFRITDHLRVQGRFEMIKPEDLMQTILASTDAMPVAAPAEAPKPTASRSPEG